MSMNSVLARIINHPHLPTPPPVALKVLETASRPDCNIREIGALISLDPGLCARLLQIVNSAFYSLRYKVTSVDRAVALLGLSRVRALVLSLSLPNMRRPIVQDGRMRDLWKMSVASAIAAREWAVMVKHPDPNNEMVAGLLCDVGVQVLCEVFPEDYARILTEPPGCFVRNQCALERETWGLDHAEVGAHVLRHWGLPDELTQTIRYHHVPDLCADDSVRDRAARMHFAALVGQLQFATDDPTLVPELLERGKARFRLDGSQLEEFLARLDGKIEEFGALLNVDVRATQQYSVLITRATEQLARIASETALENIRIKEEREHIDRLRRHSQEELSRLSRRHDLILNAAGEGIFGVDRHGIIIFVNPAGAAMLARSRNEMVGSHQHELMQASAAGSAPSWEDSAIYAVLLDGQPRFVEDGLFARSDGTTFPVRYSCAPMREEQSIVGAVVTYRDITELKQAEENLRRSEEQLRQSQKMEIMGQLAGSVAHDFNNLLTVILGYCEMVSGDILTSDHPAYKPIIEVIKAGERASALTMQLLAFSRKQVLNSHVINLNTVVSGLESMLCRLIGSGVKLESILAPDLGMVRADPGQMEQVILNLAVNARDAMPGGGRLTITTENKVLGEGDPESRPEIPLGAYVALSLADTGCGMSRETQARIFEPFFTTKEPGKGTGLGLATVYGIVKQSGGSICVSSEVGRGTCFKVFLPMVAEVASAPLPPKVRSPRPAGRETILVADDDAAVRALVVSALRDSNYEILAAEDGLDALRVAEAHAGTIHLLLTDVVMPGMGGAMLAQTLIGQRADMRVLYVSGFTDDSAIHEGREVEAAFLQKPFTLESLTRKVREVLDAAGRETIIIPSRLPRATAAQTACYLRPGDSPVG